MTCERPGGCRTPHGCGGIKRCWWNDRRAPRRRRGNGLPQTITWKDPNRPEPGYWLITLVRNGPMVPACIRWAETECEPGRPDNDMRGTRPRQLVGFILEEPVDVLRVWHATKVEHIDELSYLTRVKQQQWAARHQPDEAIVNPRQRVDLLRHPVPF